MFHFVSDRQTPKAAKKAQIRQSTNMKKSVPSCANVSVNWWCKKARWTMKSKVWNWKKVKENSRSIDHSFYSRRTDAEGLIKKIF